MTPAKEMLDRFVAAVSEAGHPPSTVLPTGACWVTDTVLPLPVAHRAAQIIGVTSTVTHGEIDFVTSIRVGYIGQGYCIPELRLWGGSNG